MKQSPYPLKPRKLSLSQIDNLNTENLKKYFTGKNPDLLGFTIFGITMGLETYCVDAPKLPPAEAFHKIASACDRLDQDAFEKVCMFAFNNFFSPIYTSTGAAWMAIARIIERNSGGNPDPITPFDLWEEKEKNRKETIPLKLVPKRTTQNAPRHAPASTLHVQKIPEEKLPAWVTENEPLTPKIAPARKESIIEFITNRSPSFNYRKVFVFISRHTKNRFSRRGRKIYPYGQEYVARKLNLSLHTIENVFSWLRRQGIIIKRSNENPELKKSATWFVCTSWKQSFYFRDPKGLRSKKGSRRSLMKRRFHLVNT